MASNAPVIEVFKKLGVGTGVNTSPTIQIPRVVPTNSYPSPPTTSSDTRPQMVRDLFGTRIRGLLTAPASGSFRLYIASDDSSEPWLGTSSDPSTARLVARVGAAVGDKEWTNQAVQKSAAIQLTAKQQYYLEVRHKGPPEGACVRGLDASRPISHRGHSAGPTGRRGFGSRPVLADATAEVPASASANTVVIDLDAADSPWSNWLGGLPAVIRTASSPSTRIRESSRSPMRRRRLVIKIILGSCASPFRIRVMGIGTHDATRPLV